MASPSSCPVCKNSFGGAAHWHVTSTGNQQIVCEFCGVFEITGTVLATGLTSKQIALTPVQRMSLIHFIRCQNDAGREDFKLTSYWLNENGDQLKLPSPAQQATNAIRFIGDFVSRAGYMLKETPGNFFASIGSFNRDKAQKILKELKEERLVYADFNRDIQVVEAGKAPSLFKMALNVDLTLKGWELYEKEKRGKFAGSDGFIAMKFGDPILDPFVNGILKPWIREKLGMELRDLRDVSRAGIIDNIMRERIRDAAFVLVDLTHGNAGAYWEAGYAEGLGKPVIYLCEQATFDEKKTHFDTNHCTTVMWSGTGDNSDFKNQLVSTIRRSLNLFE